MRSYLEAKLLVDASSEVQSRGPVDALKLEVVSGRTETVNMLYAEQAE